MRIFNSFFSSLKQDTKRLINCKKFHSYFFLSCFLKSRFKIVVLATLFEPLMVTTFFFLCFACVYTKKKSYFQQDETRIGYLMLKIQLTVVDLLLLIFYIPPKLLWLYYYEWPFGKFTCKSVVYLWLVELKFVLLFYLSFSASNLNNFL